MSIQRRASLLQGLIVTTVLFILIFTISFPTYAQETKKMPIRIGHINTLTGPLTENGVALMAGAKMAFDNAGWVVAGKRIEYISEDMAADISLCTEKCKKLVELDKCSIIFGPVLSAANLAIAPYAEKMRVVLLSSATVINAFTENYEYTFSPAGDNMATAYPMGRYCSEKLGYRTCTMLTLEAEAGYWWDIGFKRGFAEGGGKVIQQQRAPRTTTDFAPYLSRLQKADFALIHFAAAPSYRVIQQYYEFKLWEKMPIVSYEGAFVQEEHLEKYGDAAIGIICSSQWTSRIDTPQAKKFVNAFKEKNKRIPGAMDYYGYRMASIAIEALAAVKGDISNSPKLYEAFKNVKIETPAGSFRFGPDRMGITNMYIFKVVKEGGELLYKVLYTYKDNPSLRPTPEELKEVTGKTR